MFNICQPTFLKENMYEDNELNKIKLYDLERRGLIKIYQHDRMTGEPSPYWRKKDKVGRNSPCPCGSGKKYKKCCLALGV